MSSCIPSPVRKARMWRTDESSHGDARVQNEPLCVDCRPPHRMLRSQGTFRTQHPGIGSIAIHDEERGMCYRRMGWGVGFCFPLLITRN